MGFMFGKGNQTLETYECVNQDVKFSQFRNNERSLDKSLQSYRYKEKGEFSYEFNFFQDADYEKLLYSCQNFSTLHEGHFLLPIPFTDYYAKCILSPSKAYKLDAQLTAPWETAYTAMSNLDEFSAGEYTAISALNTSSVHQATAPTEYRSFVFEFDLSNFISQFGYKVLRRLTLQYNGMDSSPIRFYLWSPARSAWYLLTDKKYYNDADFSQSSFYLYKQLVAQTGTPWGADSIYSEFVTNNKVVFMVTTKTVAQSIIVNYLRLFANGYWVSVDNDSNFENFSVAFTGAGRSGMLKLSEV